MRGWRRLAIIGLTDQYLHQRIASHDYAEAVRRLEMLVRALCSHLRMNWWLGALPCMPQHRPPCTSAAWLPCWQPWNIAGLQR